MNESSKQVWWGLFVLALGIYFLIRQLDLFAIPPMGDIWPIFVVGAGIARLLSWRTSEHVEGGVLMILIGLWLFACELHWWDFTYRTTWPVVLTIVGLSMVVRSVLDGMLRQRTGGES